MTDSASREDLQTRIRLTQLRSLDGYASEILEVAGKTALYNYSQSGETWSKTDVEGTLMIYTRTAKPKHMITIVNKNSKSNFVEPITKNCDAQLKAPYVLLRNDSMNILGIWFADQKDVLRIYEAIGKYIKIEDNEYTKLSGNLNAVSLSSQPSIAPLLPGAPSHPITANSMDIMSMLSRAHGEFETKKTDGPDSIMAITQGSIATDLIKPSPIKPASPASKGTSAAPVKEDSSVNPPADNTVADFFAKVGLGPPMNNNTTPNKPQQHHQSTIDKIVSTTSFSSSSASVASAAAIIQTSTETSGNNNNNCNANPVLQQMFQGAAAVGGQASVDNNNCIGSNPVTIPQRPREQHVQNCAPSTVGVVGSLKKAGQPAPMSLQELEGKLRENLTVSGSSGSGSQDSYIPFNDLLGASPSSNKPNLMCPQMFTIGKPLIEDLTSNNTSGLLKSPGIQPLLTPQEELPVMKRVPPYNNSEMNPVPFRIVPQTPPGMSTSLASPNASASNIQNLFSNSYNCNNNGNISNSSSDVKDNFIRNHNDMRLLDSRPPGILHHQQQHQQQQQQAQQQSLHQLSQQVVQQDRTAMVLNQDQFVTALSHALTKEEFVKQLHQAYEEAMLLKSPKC